MPIKFNLNHITLYAKNWYIRSDNFWDDIYKCLTTPWYYNDGSEHSYMMLPDEKESMYNVILNKYTESMHKEPHKLVDFIKAISPTECWKSGYSTKDYPFKQGNEELPEYDYMEAVVRVILSNISIWNNSNFPNLHGPIKDCLPFKDGADVKFKNMRKSNLKKKFNI